jgi:cysteine desulfurase
VIAFDLEGVAVSAGSACSSGKVGAPYVLTAMGGPEAEAATAIRASLGWNSRDEDVDRFIRVYRDLYERHRARRAPCNSQQTTDIRGGAASSVSAAS